MGVLARKLVDTIMNLFLVFSSLLVVLPDTSAYPKPEADIASLEQKIQDLQNEVKELKQESRHCRLLKEDTCGKCMCRDDHRLVSKHFCDCTNLQPLRDCKSFLEAGHRTNGVYTIKPFVSTFDVFCDMTTDGGGWTVFQRRRDGSENFYRDWQDYKVGFGELQNEFWLGNEKLHTLSWEGTYPVGNELRIELADFEGQKKYAKYDQFSVGSEATSYTLEVDEYSGDAGDAGNALLFHNGRPFSTYDHETEGTVCGRTDKGGWWYKNCALVCLNGRYYGFKDDIPLETGIYWYPWHGNNKYSLKFTEMKMRRKN